jgi:hypothetical protein
MPKFTDFRVILYDRNKSLSVIQVRMSEMNERQNLSLDQVQSADMSSEGGVAINHSHATIGKSD